MNKNKQLETSGDSSVPGARVGFIASVARAKWRGFAAGLLAGLGVAMLDSLRLWILGGVDFSLPGFAAVGYGLFAGVVGAACGGFYAIVARRSVRVAKAEEWVGLVIGLVIFSVLSLAVSAFYFQRDVFGEKVGMLAPKMLAVIAGSGVVLLALSALVVVLLRVLVRRVPVMRASWFSAAIWLCATVLLLGAGQLFQGNARKGITAAAPSESAPNVLLVLSDTHRADYTGVYGGRKDLTPELDRFAEDGVVYQNTFATASWTKPSVASILTGRYPSSHTATLKGSILPDEITTLAEVMEQGGYENIGIATNYNLTPFFNFNQGFHDYRYLAPEAPFGASDEQAKLIFVEVAKKIAAKFKGGRETPAEYYVIGETVTDIALARLKERDSARPFFMFVSYMDVHDPYFRHPYDGYAISHRGSGDVDPSDTKRVAEMKSLYEGEVRYWDGHFGRLIDGLRQQKLFDNTMIVVVSDHGEEFGEHGGFWHGTTLYDEQVRVIHIVKYPRISPLAAAAGQSTPVWHSLVDVAPMIIAETGLKVPAEMQGKTSRSEDRSRIFSEEDHQGNVLSSVRFEGPDGKAMKIIRANKGNPRGLKETELYDMEADPVEKKDLSSSAPEAVSTGDQALSAAAEEAKVGRAASVSGELAGDMKAQLDALGYMEDEKKK